MLNVTTRAVVVWCQKGKIPAVQIDRKWFIGKAAIDAKLAEAGVDR